MKKVQEALKMLPLVAVVIGLCLAAQPSVAQTASTPNPNAAQQQPMPQQDGATPAAETATFTGKIVKSGSKLVLTDAEGKTTYQLDDQQKAKEFVNKNVKVTGTLDGSTGMIRVSVIEPV